MRVALLFFLVGSLSAANASGAKAPVASTQQALGSDALWTQLTKKQKRKNAPLTSLAPLVEQAQEALLVVMTQQKIGATSHSLPPGHPPLPPKHPPVLEKKEENSPQGPGHWMNAEGYGGIAHHFGGQGSGFLIHPTGLALTNYHVVEHASDLRVRVGSHPEEFPAEIVGFDAKSDVALVRIQSKKNNWPILPLGDSDALSVGDFVVSLGAPYGLAHSVSMGILSGRGRHDVHPDGRGGLYDFLQTDVGLHAGNSGGPLLNLEGEVVAMNTAANSHSAQIGFSIPINLVKRLLPKIFRDGRVTRAWIGVGIQALTQNLALAFGRTNNQGALIHDVVTDGPADKGGIVAGDIVLRFGDRQIKQAHELAIWAGESPVGQEVKVQIWRANKLETLSVRLDAHPDNRDPPELSENSPAVIDVQKGSDLGLRVVTLNRTDRNELALPPDLEGARVVDVRLGSPAFLAGIRPDDVVIEFEGNDIRSAEAFATQIDGSESGRMMRVRLWRADRTLYVALEKL